MDIMTGKRYKMPLFYQVKKFVDKGDFILGNQGFKFFKKTGEIEGAKGRAELNSLIITG